MGSSSKSNSRQYFMKSFICLGALIHKSAKVVLFMDYCIFLCLSSSNLLYQGRVPPLRKKMISKPIDSRSSFLEWPKPLWAAKLVNSAVPQNGIPIGCLMWTLLKSMNCLAMPKSINFSCGSPLFYWSCIIHIFFGLISRWMCPLKWTSCMAPTIWSPYWQDVLTSNPFSEALNTECRLSPRRSIIKMLTYVSFSTAYFWLSWILGIYFEKLSYLKIRPSFSNWF